MAQYHQYAGATMSDDVIFRALRAKLATRLGIGPDHQPTTTQRPYSPIPLDYIKQELDKQGYDFIPGMFLAIKRTGMWRVE